MLFVTDDWKHDTAAVQHFIDKSLHYIDKWKFKKVVIFSDGCAAQYKDSNCLVAFSMRKYLIEWNFFGSDHRKSEADGELDSLNRALDLGILGRQVIIRCAQDIVDWANDRENLRLDEAGSKSHFHYVPTDAINRDETVKAATVKDLRNFHQVKNVCKDYEILVRSLSCYCRGCINYTECLNWDNIENFVKRTIEVKKSTVETEDMTDTVPADTHLVFDGKVNKEFQNFSNFDSVQKFVNGNFSKIPQLPTPDVNISLLSTRKKIDQNSLTLVPDDLEEYGELYPAIINGDGNCLPRCVSLLAYGTESKFKEIRQRIVVELVINEKLYLEDENNKIFSMFSDYYHGQKLTPSGIRKIFRAEVL
ncbi:hypothetical protein SNE40_001618 [Patella caerulea]|uniref:OTU domain-containing protein n=1 Tax=Patella caerulea TaxID=87958 RepID=A0AAN8KP66_PATCE